MSRANRFEPVTFVRSPIMMKLLSGRIVSVSSPAREEDIRQWLDTADRYSSWRDNIANAVPLVCERRVTSTAR